MPPRLTVEYINTIISKENYVCTAYDIKTKKFSYLCPKKHIGSMRMDHWRRGVRCATCKGNKKLTIPYIKKQLAKEGYSLISTNYTSSNVPLVTKCPSGHTFNISWNNWHTGYRCSKCSARAKKDIDDIALEISKEQYTLVSKKYNNNKQKLTLICPNKHLYKVSWDNWNSKKSRCPKCALHGISEAELNLHNYISSIYNGTIIFNDRSFFGGKELDIVLPDIKVAIEYNGLYWHSEEMGKDKNYHINKLNECVQKGYKLITIFEDEWLSLNSICKSRLCSIIRPKEMNILYARNCIIKEITATEARLFCTTNHIQGYGAGASIKLGAFYEGLLVAIMTFSKPSFVKGYKQDKKDIYELHRFCTFLNYRIIGIASKLLAYFERNYKCTTLFSYADRRWSSGNLYTTLGFEYKYNTKPNYWYFKDSTHRIYRYNLKKPKHYLGSLTEKQLRLAQGYKIIWDCGSFYFIKNY